MRRWGSLLIAIPAMLAASPAIAGSCAASAQYNFAFADQNAATLTYGNIYTYSASATAGGSRSFTVNVSQNGLSNTTINGSQMPQISTLITGTDNTKRDLVFGGAFGGRTASITGTTNVITLTFTFTTPIRDFAITMHDVDFASGQYRDWVNVSGSDGTSTFVPVTATPWGQSNASGGARTNGSSSLSLGTATTPLTLTASQAAGTGNSAANSDTGTMSASFAQPVTTVTVKYGNAPFTTGDTSGTGQQAIGVQGISFCPMPALTVVKASTPVSGTYGKYNIPGNDVTYSLTVTNSGASPVDGASIVLTDLLPAKTTFKNATLDTTTGLPFAISSGTSGVSLTSSSAKYSSDNGATWTYTPASGYDTKVTGVQLTPSGTMAANSSFTITFLAQIK